MDNYNLQPNEGVIRKSSNVMHGGILAAYTDELILTNFNIIYISRGVFGNKKGMQKFPLNQLKIINDKPQIIMGKMKNGLHQLEIYFTNGQQNFVFQSSGKKEINEWINDVYKIVVGESAGLDTTEKSKFSNVVKDTVDTFKDVIGVKKSISQQNTMGEATVKKTAKCMACRAPICGFVGKTIRCRYCDTEQNL